MLRWCGSMKSRASAQLQHRYYMPIGPVGGPLQLMTLSEEQDVTLLVLDCELIIALAVIATTVALFTLISHHTPLELTVTVT